MANIIIHKKDSEKIVHFIEDCIKKGNSFFGVNKKIIGLNPNIWEYTWVDDTANPILGIDNEIIGWDKNVSDLTPSTDIAEIKPPTRNETKEALKLKKVIDNLSYQELDDYIETNVVDLASAKMFIKTLAKVTLALCKLIDNK
jgi:hypothetical protein